MPTSILMFGGGPARLPKVKLCPVIGNPRISCFTHSEQVDAFQFGDRVSARPSISGKAKMPFLIRFLSGLWILAICLAATVGCGKSTATVAGKVTLNGAPVTAGAVTFHGEDKFVKSAGIDSSGSYAISNAPVGPVKVTVVAAQPRKGRDVAGKTAPKHPGDKAGAPATFVALPEKYKDPNLSGLNFTLTAGEQTINLPLQ